MPKEIEALRVHLNAKYNLEGSPWHKGYPRVQAFLALEKGLVEGWELLPHGGSLWLVPTTDNDLGGKDV